MVWFKNKGPASEVRFLLSMVSVSQAHLDLCQNRAQGTVINKQIKLKKNCFTKVSTGM